jgi:hypothetical protein
MFRDRAVVLKLDIGMESDCRHEMAYKGAMASLGISLVP